MLPLTRWNLSSQSPALSSSPWLVWCHYRWTCSIAGQLISILSLSAFFRFLVQGLQYLGSVFIWQLSPTLAKKNRLTLSKIRAKLVTSIDTYLPYNDCPQMQGFSPFCQQPHRLLSKSMMNWSMKNLFSAAPALSIVPALPPELAALLKREREQQQYLQYGQASLTNGMDSKMMMMLVSRRRKT